MKYAFIKKYSKDHGVRKMCEVLEISKSGFYDWRKRAQSRRKRLDQVLVVEIKKVHEGSKERYGVVKTWKALKHQGIPCGKHRVARLRRENRIESKRRKRFKITTRSKSTDCISPNVLNRSFQAPTPNTAWVGDVTFIATRNGNI